MNSFTKRDLLERLSLAGLGVAVVAAAMPVAPSPAVAQSTALALEEIVVTARKREESILDIPLSVTAFSANQIKNQAITDVEDLLQFTPGVHMSNNTGNRNNPAIRFRGIDPPSSERNAQTSSAFLDGVYLPGTSQWISMNDIERVEIVKGPQSAFFGRATFGGAINFVSRTPGNEFAADVDMIIGDHGRFDLWASAEGPIIEDKLSIRAGGRFYTYNGGYGNLHPSGGRLGAQETLAGNITLYATPTEDLSIKIRHVHTRDEDGHPVLFLAKGENNNCGPFETNGVLGTDTYYCGTLTQDLISNGFSIDLSPLDTDEFKDDLGLDRTSHFTSMNIDWDIGGYTLSSVTGYYVEKTNEMRELLTDELLVYLNWEDESFSQEIRLASPDDERLRWMIGGYYLDLTYGKSGQSGFPCIGEVAPFPFCGFGAPVRGGVGLFPFTPATAQKVDNKAVFASLAYDITEQLTLSAEFRYEVEKIANATSVIQEAMPLDPNDPIGTAQPFGGAEVDVAGTFKAKLPRVILDYKPTEDWLLYASYARGNTPGGFNLDILGLEPTVAAPAFFAAEGIGPNVLQAKLKAYETGVKYSLPEGRGVLNGAIYFMEWSNQRFRGLVRDVDSNGDGVYIIGSDRIGGQVDFQANGSTDIWGFELSGSYVLTENWAASFSYNYNKTDIKVYEDGFVARVFGDGDASDKEVARSPRHAATFALDYVRPSGEILGQDGEWFGRWDAWYQGFTYNWVVNLAKTEATLLHNLRGGWRNDQYSVTFWVENVMDNQNVLSSSRTTGSFLTGTLGYQFTLPDPRSFGVTLSANF